MRMNTIVTFVGGNRTTKAPIFCNSSFYLHNEACVAAMLKIEGPGVSKLCKNREWMLCRNPVTGDHSANIRSAA